MASGENKLNQLKDKIHKLQYHELKAKQEEETKRRSADSESDSEVGPKFDEAG